MTSLGHASDAEHLADNGSMMYRLSAGDKISVSADAEKKGVHFDLQEIFERRLKQPSCTQVRDIFRQCSIVIRFFVCGVHYSEPSYMLAKILDFYTILSGLFQDHTRDILLGCRRMLRLGQPILRGLTWVTLHGFGRCKHAEPLKSPAAVGVLPGTQAGMPVVSPQGHAILGKD